MMPSPVERPVIFSAAMVSALLAGRKTQTRRLATSPLRRVEPGVLLWVREAHSIRVRPEDATDGIGRVWYREGSEWGDEIRWRPSIHMPRWASRLTLEVTAVRRQRLLDLDEADFRAEGLELSDYDYGDPTARMASWRSEFAALWDGLHNKPGVRWEDDPAVVAITFRRLFRPGLATE